MDYNEIQSTIDHAIDACKKAQKELQSLKFTNDDIRRLESGIKINPNYK